MSGSVAGQGQVGIGPLDPAVVGGLTGLEIMQRMIEGRLPKPPIGAAMNFDLVSAGAGRAAFAETAEVRFLNPYGTVHGGYVATLLDSAMTCAVQTTVEAFQEGWDIEIVPPSVVERGAEDFLVHVMGGAQQLRGLREVVRDLGIGGIRH